MSTLSAPLMPSSGRSTVCTVAVMEPSSRSPPVSTATAGCAALSYMGVARLSCEKAYTVRNPLTDVSPDNWH